MKPSLNTSGEGRKKLLKIYEVMAVDVLWMVKYVELEEEYSRNAFSINIFSRSQAINLKFFSLQLFLWCGNVQLPHFVGSRECFHCTSRELACGLPGPLEWWVELQIGEQRMFLASSTGNRFVRTMQLRNQFAARWAAKTIKNCSIRNRRKNRVCRQLLIHWFMPMIEAHFWSDFLQRKSN